MSAIGDKIQATAARLTGSWVFWLVFCTLAIALPLGTTMLRDTPAKVPVLSAVANFRLIDQHGNAFGSPELKHRVWVASMNCLDCPYGSAEFAERLYDVQHRTRKVGSAFHLVTISLEPEEDTPAELLAFAEKHRASRGRWSFLTGDPEAVRTAITEIFGVVQPRGKAGTPRHKAFDSTRSYYLALVDQKAQVRGYYDSREDSEIDALLKDISLIVNRGD